jgi:membrane protein implicated in regulation of membrane protease activity
MSYHTDGNRADLKISEIFAPLVVVVVVAVVVVVVVLPRSSNSYPMNVTVPFLLRCHIVVLLMYFIYRFSEGFILMV